MRLRVYFIDYLLDPGFFNIAKHGLVQAVQRCSDWLAKNAIADTGYFLKQQK